MRSKVLNYTQRLSCTKRCACIYMYTYGTQQGNITCREGKTATKVEAFGNGKQQQRLKLLDKAGVHKDSQATQSR
jgi:hypothetical protein